MIVKGHSDLCFSTTYPAADPTQLGGNAFLSSLSPNASHYPRTL